MLASFYDDAVNWAFSSKAKEKDFANSEEGNTIVHVSDTAVMIDIPVMVEIMSSFFQNMKLRYNDGNGTKDIVTFLGDNFIDGMQLKCNVRLSDDSTKLVDPETLNFIENPGITLSHKHQRNIEGVLFISIHQIWSIFSSQSHYLHFKKKCLAINIAYIMNLFQR
jgi:hypothetical protein